MGILNDLSNLKFYGKGETPIYNYTTHFLQIFTKHNIHCEDVACRLFILTFEARIKEWCYTSMDSSIHSFNHIIKEIFHAFGRYDYKFIFKKIMHLKKATDESLDDFHYRFFEFCFEFSEDDVDWNLMKQKFKFLVHI